MTEQEIKRAFRDYIWNSEQPNNSIINAEERAFSAGVQFLLDEGVRYSEEDMRAAFREGWEQAMIALDKSRGKIVGVDEFIEERSKSK